jgi:catabolite regulation protein CreA
MAHKILLVALSMIAAGSPVSASQIEEVPTVAPAAGPDARYCLRIEAITGSRIERVRCWTREEWAANDVDVDAEWAEEGVRVIG